MKNLIIKKKLMNLVIIFILVMLCSCGQQGETIENISKINNSEAIQSTFVPEEAAEPSFSQDEDTIVSVDQAFTAVLLNEMPIFYTDKVPYQLTVVTSEYTDFLMNLPNLSYGKNEKMIISQFTVVDMDGDALPEIVLETEDDSGYLNGYCLLRYRQGEVCGYAIGSRSLENLREDGTHMGDAGAGDIWIEKLYFVGDTIVKDEIAHMEEGDSYGNYTFHGINVDKSVWDDIESSFYETKEAEWHEFTEETIREWVTENSLFKDIPIEAVAEISERQNYLDSLSYLIELTYDSSLNQQEKPEQFHADADSYYAGCMNEMNKIYQLCQGKLSGQILESLQVEQEDWQQELDLRLKSDLNKMHNNSLESVEEQESILYYNYGDVMFRRTLDLISIYYDSQLMINRLSGN